MNPASVIAAADDLCSGRYFTATDLYAHLLEQGARGQIAERYGLTLPMVRIERQDGRLHLPDLGVTERGLAFLTPEALPEIRGVVVGMERVLSDVDLHVRTDDAPAGPLRVYRCKESG